MWFRKKIQALSWYIELIQVVVGLIYNERGEILVAKRQAHKFQGGRFEFPGGKVESDETFFQALQRELKEELGIEVISANPWWQTQFDYSDRVIVLNIWRIISFSGVPHGREGQPIRWVSLVELSALEIPDANKVIVEKLVGAHPMPRRARVKVRD